MHGNKYNINQNILCIVPSKITNLGSFDCLQYNAWQHKFTVSYRNVHRRVLIYLFKALKVVPLDFELKSLFGLTQIPVLAPEIIIWNNVQSDTRFGAPVLGLPSSAITYIEPLFLCWVPQEGVDTKGVFRDMLVFMLMLIGVNTLVGVRPVLPSISASKLRLVIAFVGVSIGMPSMLLI